MRIQMKKINRQKAREVDLGEVRGKHVNQKLIHITKQKMQTFMDFMTLAEAPK